MPHLKNAVITAMQGNLNCGWQRVKFHENLSPGPKGQGVWQTYIGTISNVHGSKPSYQTLQMNVIHLKTIQSASHHTSSYTLMISHLLSKLSCSHFEYTPYHNSVVILYFSQSSNMPMPNPLQA
jgi:hypothetical protein